MRTPSIPSSPEQSSNRRLWWVALALVPVGVSLLALGLRARRAPGPDPYEAWWQARDAARATGPAVPVSSRNGSSLFV